MKHTILLLAITLIVASCGNQQKGNKAQNAPVPFPYPQTPSMMTSQGQMAEYMMTHFWDNYFNTAAVSGSDTTMVGRVPKNDFIKALGRFASLMDMCELNTVERGIDSLFAKAERCGDEKIWKEVAHYIEEFLWNPDSQVRNEEYWLYSLENLVSSPFTSESDKVRFNTYIPLCSLNRIGTKAADFPFTRHNGRNGTLYTIDAEFVLLFISNPGCNMCKEIIEALNKSMRITKMIESKELAVLNLYPDEDLTAWYDYLPNYPKTWINALDSEKVFDKGELYNLRAVPSLYLLDKEKRVVYKDAPLEKILGYLTNFATK